MSEAGFGFLPGKVIRIFLVESALKMTYFFVMWVLTCALVQQNPMYAWMKHEDSHVKWWFNCNDRDVCGAAPCRHKQGVLPKYILKSTVRRADGQASYLGSLEQTPQLKVFILVSSTYTNWRKAVTELLFGQNNCGRFEKAILEVLLRHWKVNQDRLTIFSFEITCPQILLNVVFPVLKKKKKGSKCMCTINTLLAQVCRWQTCILASYIKSTHFLVVVVSLFLLLF